MAFHFEDLDADGSWIPQLTDFQDPEAFLIAQETLAQLRDVLGAHERSVLLGQPSMEQYSHIVFQVRLSDTKSEQKCIFL